MDKQEKYDRAYLEMAHTWGQLSYCERKKVGALIVCLLYTSPSPRDVEESRMPSSA